MMICAVKARRTDQSGNAACRGVFDALDVGNTAVIVGRAEGDNEQLVLADLILIARIVERSVAGIEAEVIRAGLVAFDELLLRIGQGVPGGLGRFALGVGLIGAGLDIDRVDQGGDIVGGCLIQLFLRGLRLFRGLLLGGRGLFGGSGLFGFCGVYGGVSSALLLQAERRLSSITAASTSARVFFM